MPANLPDFATPVVATEPAAQLAQGEVVGGFRIKWRLGGGAMGEVYLAIDEQLGRKVALKLVRSAALEPGALERFLEEARTTARFSHPHIVTVYEVGLHLGRPYLALEFLDGSPLRARLGQGPLPAREVLRLGRAVADALAEAHAAQVVHADLKPDNVVIPRDGRPRVVDFGLARLASSGASGASGTPAYMAPERWAGAALTPAVDVWALGVTLCEALDGKRPFTDKELVQLAYAPQPVTLGPAASGSPCAALLRRCLAPLPEDRPTAAEVALELEALLGGRAGDEGRSPFRGLESFTEADAQDFHGRDADTEAVVERLRTEGLVPIVGPSGVGKTSFLQAGVIPRLREGGPQLVVTCRPGRRPLTGLLAALVTAGLEARSEPVLAARSSPGFLVRALRALARSKQTRVLLVLDQFEEAVTLGEAGETAQLLAALAAASLADEAFRVLVAFRSDFLGSFAETALQPSLASLTVLRPLGPAALVQALVGPLKRVGYRPDDEALPGRMATELEGQGAALPLLQFAADALWRRRDAGQRLVLTREYEAMGGATGALATHAERLAAQLSPEERAQTRALLLHLVTVEGTRRPRTRAELLAQAGLEAAPTLDRLLANRLLVSGSDEETGEALVELAHESLTSTWPALARWLAETEAARRLEHELEQAAALWDARGRAAAETWHGTPLRDALHHLAQWRLTPGPLAQAFLDAGVAEAARLRRRGRLQLGGAFAGLTALLVAAAVAAAYFRAQERLAVAQQQEIRLAAADMGRFELVLEPFDWDADAMAARPVSAASLPGLEVRFHDTVLDRENEPGPLVDARYVIRGAAAVAADGARHEVMELRSRPAWIELTGRGAGGQRCAPSWVLARTLPGFAEREAVKRLTLKVPTCQATRAGTVEVPAGPFYLQDLETKAWKEVDLPTYRIDVYETTREAYAVYASMSGLHGDTPQSLGRVVLPRAQARLPEVTLSPVMVDRYCQFRGMRTQTANQWRKAARGGLWLDAARTVPNPAPKRPTPWGTRDRGPANVLTDPTQAVRLLPVGSFPLDRGPSGALDLFGSGLELTRDRIGELRIAVGASVGFVTPDAQFVIDEFNQRLEFSRPQDGIARCVEE